MNTLSRRNLILNMSKGAAGLFLLPKLMSGGAVQKLVKKGRLKQSVSYWCYQKYFKLPEFARLVAEMGLPAIDLLQPEQWEIVRQAGLVSRSHPRNPQLGEDAGLQGRGRVVRHGLPSAV